MQGALGALLALLLLGGLFAIVQSHFDSSFATLIGMTPSFLPWTLALALVLSGGLLGAIRGAAQRAQVAQRMSLRVSRFSPALGVLLLALSVGAIGAPAEDDTDPSESAEAAPVPARQRDLGGDAERRLVELTRQTQAGHAELERLGKDSDAAHARTVTRGRVYVRLAQAGLLPVGGGFDALVEHAVRLERAAQCHRS